MAELARLLLSREEEALRRRQTFAADVRRQATSHRDAAATVQAPLTSALVAEAKHSSATLKEHLTATFLRDAEAQLERFETSNLNRFPLASGGDPSDKVQVFRDCLLASFREELRAYAPALWSVRNRLVHAPVPQLDLLWKLPLRPPSSDAIQRRKSQRAIRLLDSWLEEDEQNPGDDDWERLRAELDKNRLSTRKLFP